MTRREQDEVEGAEQPLAQQEGSRPAGLALGALGRGLAYFGRVSEHEHRLALEREHARR